MNPAKLTFRRRELLASVAVAGAAGAARLAVPGLALLSGAGARAQDSGTRLVLLGTQGGPNFNVERGESANAVVVEGETYLVDCGYGTLMALRRAGLSYRDLAATFLTHLHDDHSGDIAALLSHQWSDGRIEPMTVYGPYGTEQMVQAAIAFSEANTRIRVIDEARSVEPAHIFAGMDLEATSEPAEVHADERVVVSSVENTHFPESSKREMPYRSLSYRLDSADRSIAFSGDTAYSENLVELARGADVLVCEAMQVVAMRAAFDRMVAGGAYADNAEGVWAHIVGTHTTTEEAGQMAAEAGVGTLVLSHLIPGALGDLDDEDYIEGVRRHFDGEVIVGRDQMVI